MRARITNEVSEEAVLYQYLDSLLTEPEAEHGEDTCSGNDVVHPPSQTNMCATNGPAVAAEPAPQPDPSGPVSQSRVDMIFSADDSKAAIFHINNAKIGIPARFVSAIIENDSKLGITRHHEKDCYGSLTYHGHHYRLLDVQSMLEHDNESQSASDYRTIILLEPGHWGIICHNFDSIRPLDIRNIKWRKDRSTRNCLAGVDIAEMCLIFDINAAINNLETST